MMNYKKPDDWVLATGETHTVREFVEKAFGYFQLIGKNMFKYQKNILDLMKLIIY